MVSNGPLHLESWWVVCTHGQFLKHWVPLFHNNFQSVNHSSLVVQCPTNSQLTPAQPCHSKTTVSSWIKSLGRKINRKMMQHQWNEIGKNQKNVNHCSKMHPMHKSMKMGKQKWQNIGTHSRQNYICASVVQSFCESTDESKCRNQEIWRPCNRFNEKRIRSNAQTQ